MGFTSGNPSVLIVKETSLNHKGRVVIPEAMRDIIGVGKDSKVTLTLHADRTVKLERVS